jgi:O-antigen ligase
MGTFATNQDFGVFTACLAPALLALGLNAKSHRRLFLLLTASVYVVTLLSLTRTALIASLVAGLAVLLLWGRERVMRRIATVLAAVGIVGGLGLWGLSQIDNARIQDSLTRAGTLFDLDGDTSFTARVWSTLPRGIAAFSANPWGSGSGAAGPVSRSFPTLAPFGPLTTDNGYLLIGIQTGVFGLLAFVLMLVSVLVWLARSRLALPRAGAAVITALLVALMLAGYWGLLAPMALVASVIGLALASRSRETAAVRPARRAERRVTSEAPSPTRLP